ncbi:hypothetical protein NL370_27410, partial [Klebsiella pneumoniae]|nr:hypothetical protein [Klebsiella pneumoniae]
IVRTSLQKKGQSLQNWRDPSVKKATRLQHFINGWLFYPDCRSLRKQVRLYYPRLASCPLCSGACKKII